MIRRFALLFVFVALLSSLSLFADEGMWLFNAPPKAQIKAKYGFDVTQAWLDHVRLSSVRFNNGGSGSFVSADGLTFTNHHVGAECVHQLSTGGKDYIKDGFYAKTRTEEAKCPDLELNVLQDIEDVTAKVNAAVKPGMSPAEAGQAQRGEMSAIEKDCTTKSGLRCDVVTLYSGAQYHLYKYKKYTDVRLVFAPEFGIAFFGGDPDNFEYPRYDLDITFFRIYENDKPVHLANYFKWSKDGVKENDLIFVSGNPGSTGRLNTMAQLNFLRDDAYPLLLKTYTLRIQALKKFAAESEENARIAQEDIFGYENSLKAVTGYNDGLHDKDLMAKKADEEKKLRAYVDSDPKRKNDFGDPWGDLEKAADAEKTFYTPYFFIEQRRGFTSEIATFARILVRAAEEKTKPNGERLREYRDSALPSLEQQLFSTAPVYKSLDTLELGDAMAQLAQTLPEDDVVKKVIAGKDPREVAKEAIAGTKLDDVAVRKQLYEGGVKAIQASTDPMIVLLRDIDPEARQLRKRYDDQVDAVERRAGGQIAKARFAQGGANNYPDATFTLRLSYGAVKSFTEDGRGPSPAGTKLPYFTTIRGAFEHAEKHGSKPPYQLPDSWLKAKSKLNLNTPLNTTSTPDIIGGNSGSPVINKNAEIVGIIFDGNIQSLPWRFAYEDRIGRSIEVDSRGIQEALRNVYGATALADELGGGAAGVEARHGHRMRDHAKEEKKEQSKSQ